ncbi:MAG: sugar transferase [Zavarzinella sp.]
MLSNFRTRPARPKVHRQEFSHAGKQVNVQVIDDLNLSPKPTAVMPILKRIIDVGLGTLLLLALSPIIAVCALLVRLTSPGPAFYSQVRLGMFGKPFIIWKLRSMRNDAERGTGAMWCGKKDKRVTFIGKILRKLHIDEFPQLLNVISGEMSLVGPRPERPEFFPALEASVPHYASRLLVRPGITGLAQAYLPPDESIETVQKKQIYDLYYIKHGNVLLDLRLMVVTGLQAVGVPHVMCRLIFVLPHPETIQPVYQVSKPGLR